MKNTKIIIKTKSKSYPIFFGKKILNTIGKKIEKKLPNFTQNISKKNK